MFEDRRALDLLPARFAECAGAALLRHRLTGRRSQALHAELLSLARARHDFLVANAGRLGDADLWIAHAWSLQMLELDSWADLAPRLRSVVLGEERHHRALIRAGVLALWGLSTRAPDWRSHPLLAGNLVMYMLVSSVESELLELALLCALRRSRELELPATALAARAAQLSALAGASGNARLAAIATVASKVAALVAAQEGEAAAGMDEETRLALATTLAGLLDADR